MNWIKIVNKSPKERSFVLVCISRNAGDYQRIPVTAYYHAGIFTTVNWHSSDITTGVTHWMELPKPPEQT